MALKIVYPICCGMDVHKSFVVACIASTDSSGVTSYKSRRFSTFTNDLKLLAAWLSNNNCHDVCMESTGKYWIPVFNILESSCRIVLAHPKYVKAIRGKKTDVKDAKWIADIFKHDLVSGSFIPPYEIRQLRDLMRYRYKLTNFTVGEKNRAQNCLTVSNVKLDDVFSDVFGKSSSAILDKLSVCPNGNFDVSSLVSRKCKTPIAKIQAEQLLKLGIIRSHLSAIHECKSNLESLICSLADKFRAQVELVSSVPGIQFFSAVSVISEIGVDMSVFPTAKHLCSWAGLVPQNNESAGKKKSTRVSRAGAYLKPLLVQCALTVCNSSKHPEIQHRYLMLKKRRGHKKAIIAICRMLLTAIYAILKTATPYNPFLYRSHSSAPQNRTFTPDSAIAFLKSHGYVVVDCDGVVT